MFTFSLLYCHSYFHTSFQLQWTWPNHCKVPWIERKWEHKNMKHSECSYLCLSAFQGQVSLPWPRHLSNLMLFGSIQQSFTSAATFFSSFWVSFSRLILHFWSVFVAAACLDLIFLSMLSEESIKYINLRFSSQEWQWTDKDKCRSSLWKLPFSKKTTPFQCKQYSNRTNSCQNYGDKNHWCHWVIPWVVWFDESTEFLNQFDWHSCQCAVHVYNTNETFWRNLHSVFCTVANANWMQEIWFVVLFLTAKLPAITTSQQTWQLNQQIEKGNLILLQSWMCKLRI